MAYPLDGEKAPDEGCECQCRVDVQAELGERTACAGEDGYEPIHTGDLVEEL